ncbi:MAG: hypothetical protein ACHQW9_02525 [Nitrososphaerales archaeon]
MSKKCKQCGKDYDSDSELFCSEMCHDAFDLDIKERLEDALRNDKSHTQEMSS